MKHTDSAVKYTNLIGMMTAAGPTGRRILVALLTQSQVVGLNTVYLNS